LWPIDKVESLLGDSCLERKRLKIAVVGLGKMGLLHASILNVFPDVELVALCDKSALMKRLYKKIFSSVGVKVIDDFEKLSGFDLDAVYVTTPISSHSFIVKNLYTEKIVRNFFVEKTLASDFDQAKELCALAQDFDSTTMVGYMKRFSVIFRKAKELLTEGTLGEPYSFKGYAYSSDFVGSTKESKSSASRGGAIRDMGCHLIDLALWLLGDLEVRDILSGENSGIGSETSSFKAVNSAGLEGQFDISQSMPDYRMPEFGLSIDCSKGRIEVNDDRLILNRGDGSQRKWYKQDLNDNVYFYLGESEYFREDQEFVNSLLENRVCEPNFDTASRVDYIIDQVRKGVAKK
jgi:predicted dehydrogenase